MRTGPFRCGTTRRLRYAFRYDRAILSVAFDGAVMIAVAVIVVPILYAPDENRNTKTRPLAPPPFAAIAALPMGSFTSSMERRSGKDVMISPAMVPADTTTTFGEKLEIAIVFVPSIMMLSRTISASTGVFSITRTRTTKKGAVLSELIMIRAYPPLTAKVSLAEILATP